MRVPYVQNVKSRGITFTQEFRGYNHNLRTEQGEFYEMENISLDDYPVIGTRHGELSRMWLTDTPNGIHEYKENTLMAVIGKTLYVGITADSDGVKVTDSEKLLKNSEKTFATIGTKTLIMPDKVVYDHSKNKLTNVEQRFQWDSIEVEGDYKYLMLRTIPCDVDGKHQNRIVESGPDDDEFQPTNPTDGMWWYRGYTREWLEYKADGTRWVKVEKPYTRLIPVLSNGSDIFTMWTSPTEDAKKELVALNNFFGSLNVLDSFNLAMVSMGGIDLEDAEHKDCVIYGKTKEWQDYWNIDLYTLVISGMPNTNLVIFEINIKCPELRHIFSLNNRIWGVTPNKKYDPESGEMVANPQEIFCCKLGDLTQWYNYAGTAADSFAVSLGNDNEITAGCAYNNVPHFFTEDAIIKIYGDYPSNYQTRTNKADGVVSGGHKALVQLEGVLMWVSPIGVMMYDGSQPYFRGEKFSPHFLDGKNVAAGKDGTKYCLSVSHKVNGQDVSDGIYMYDTKLGMWARSRDNVIVMASELKNSLCYLDSGANLVMLYDKGRTEDRYPHTSLDLINMTERSASSEVVMDDTKYITGMLLQDHDSYEQSSYASCAMYPDDLRVTTTDSTYDPTDPDDVLTAFYGTGFPVNVTPGETYVIDYKTEGNSGKYVGIHFTGVDSAVYGIEPGEKVTVPSGATGAYLVFGAYAAGLTHYYGISMVHVLDSEDVPIAWSLETGNLGLDSPYQKYISRIQLRADYIGTFMVDISYDDSEYMPVFLSESDHMHSITVPIKVRRNDHFKIRMTGTGQMRLYSFGYETDEGSARCLI